MFRCWTAALRINKSKTGFLECIFNVKSVCTFCFGFCGSASSTVFKGGVLKWHWNVAKRAGGGWTRCVNLPQPEKNLIHFLLPGFWRTTTKIFMQLLRCMLEYQSIICAKPYGSCVYSVLSNCMRHFKVQRYHSFLRCFKPPRSASLKHCWVIRRCSRRYVRLEKILCYWLKAAAFLCNWQ